MVKGAKKLCKTVEAEEVCNGVIDLNIDTLTYIIDNDEGLAAQTICDSFLPKGCAGIPPSIDFKVNIDENVAKLTVIHLFSFSQVSRISFLIPEFQVDSLPKRCQRNENSPIF